MVLFSCQVGDMLIPVTCVKWKFVQNKDVCVHSSIAFIFVLIWSLEKSRGAISKLVSPIVQS